jgi:peptide/nickel transport system permease protein
MASQPTTLAQPGGAPTAAAIDFETTKEVGFYGLVWRRFKQRRIALVSAIVLLTITIACVVVPLFLPAECADLSQLHNGAPLGPFTSGVSNGQACLSVPAGSYFHLLGTDDAGRDLLRRILTGGRISLIIGVLVMTVTMFIATVLGAISGFFGGIVDTIVTALTNGILAIPSILILIILVRSVNGNNDAQLGPLGTQSTAVLIIVLAISVISWPTTARIIRSVILSTREKEFVEAARAVGTSRLKIIVRHLVPNALGPIVVSASLTISGAILTESAISFLGYGIQEPTPTWGKLLDEGRNALVNYPDTGIWYAFWPGMLILLTVLSLNYIGDALRDAFDPRSIER